MGVKVLGGRDVVVKVLPSEVKQLRDEEVIIVSRAQLNAEMVLLMMSKKDERTISNIQIVRNAIENMMIQEQKQKAMAIGAKMTVRDVKHIFSKLEKMPSNSFVQIKA